MSAESAVPPLLVDKHRSWIINLKDVRPLISPLSTLASGLICVVCCPAMQKRDDFDYYATEHLRVSGAYALLRLT